MTEEAIDQVKKKLAVYLAFENYPNRSKKEIEVLANTTPYPERANDIVSIPEILIKDPDQSLPENPYEPPLDGTQGIWSDIVIATQKRMLKSDKNGSHWIKVLPKE